MEMDFLGRKAVDFTFGEGDTMENGDGFGFDPIGKTAGGDQVLDLREVSAMGMFVLMLGQVRRVGVLVVVSLFLLMMVVSMCVAMLMIVMFVGMRVGVSHAICVSVLVVVHVREMNVEFDTLNGCFVSA